MQLCLQNVQKLILHTIFTQSHHIESPVFMGRTTILKKHLTDFWKLLYSAGIFYGEHTVFSFRRVPLSS